MVGSGELLSDGDGVALGEVSDEALSLLSPSLRAAPA
jgi:hypothetical protein